MLLRQDNMSHDGAERLARVIRHYWATEGFYVFPTVERSEGVWVVRSNMVNGFPTQRSAGVE